MTESILYAHTDAGYNNGLSVAFSKGEKQEIFYLLLYVQGREIQYSHPNQYTWHDKY